MWCFADSKTHKSAVYSEVWPICPRCPKQKPAVSCYCIPAGVSPFNLGFICHVVVALGWKLADMKMMPGLFRDPIGPDITLSAPVRKPSRSLHVTADELSRRRQRTVSKLSANCNESLTELANCRRTATGTLAKFHRSRGRHGIRIKLSRGHHGAVTESSQPSGRRLSTQR